MKRVVGEFTDKPSGGAGYTCPGAPDFSSLFVFVCPFHLKTSQIGLSYLKCFRDSTMAIGKT
jgi:hypothetical protein